MECRHKHILRRLMWTVSEMMFLGVRHQGWTRGFKNGVHTERVA